MISGPDVQTVSLVDSSLKALGAWNWPEILAAVGSTAATLLLVWMTYRMNQWMRRQKSPIPTFLSGVIEPKMGPPHLLRTRVEFANAGEAPIWIRAATMTTGIGVHAEGHPFEPVNVSDSGRGDATARNVLAPGGTVYVRLDVEVESEVADSWPGAEERSIPLLLHFTSGGKERVTRYALMARQVDANGTATLRLAPRRGLLAWWSKKRAERLLAQYIAKLLDKPGTKQKP